MFGSTRSQMYRPRAQALFGVPAERKVLVDEYVGPYILLGWSEEPMDWKSL